MAEGFRAFLLAAGVWLILAPATPGFLVLGAATAAFVAFLTTHSTFAGAVPSSETVFSRPLALLIYVPGALWRAVLGGIDVTGRIVRPRMDIRPKFYHHEDDGSGPVAGAVFSGTISLMPGTLAAGRHTKQGFWVHLLTADKGAAEELTAEQKRISRFVRPRILNGKPRP